MNRLDTTSTWLDILQYNVLYTRGDILLEQIKLDYFKIPEICFR